MKCEKSDIANEKDNVEVNFQMQFDLGTGNIIGAKTKAIYKDAKKDVGYEGNGAKNADSLTMLDLCAIETVCIVQKAMIEKAKHTMPLYVPVSVGTIINPYNVYEIASMIKSFNLPNGSINVVLINAECTSKADGVAKSLKHLISHNIKIYFGDIGTIALFVELMCEIEPKGVIITKSQFSGATLGSRKYIILKEIVSMCKRWELDIICDGIENALQAKLLFDLGCKKGVGDFYAKEVTLKEFEKKYFKLIW
ncbi:MAG: EAL domain-containing protein [Oscillospiraceae bacterium]